jgi:hypothetical protein
MSKLTKTSVLVVALGSLGALTLGMGPAQAAASTETDHSSFPAAGAVFACQSGALTAVSGVVDQSIHTTIDGQGIFHITGTIVPHGVTLTDAVGNIYTLSGASWFGGKGSADESSILVSTDTNHFVIHDATGGVYAKVQFVEHLSPNGKSFSFDRGACEEPVD